MSSNPRNGRRPRVSICDSIFTARFRAFLALGLSALIFATPFGFAVSARELQAQRTAVKVAANSSLKIADNHQGEDVSTKSQAGYIHRYIVEMVNGTSICRDATITELPSIMAPPDAPRERVKALPLERTDAARDHAPTQGGENVTSGGLTINLNALSQLQTDPDKAQVIAAFQKAAQFWTDRIKSPVTVDIDIDYGTNVPGTNPPKPFGPGVLGATGSASVHVDYQGLRHNLIAAANPSEVALYNSLPASVVPTDSGNGGVVDVNASVAKALGIPVGAGSVATIGFNKSFTFDFDQSDGISPGKTDFVAVATHEIGHALGFSSDAGEGSTATVTLWDLFRFRPGTTAGTFATAPRIMTIGGDQVFYTGQTYTVAGVGATELELSTGGPNPSSTDGDGWQSSHWKADDITGKFIGIMDPSVARGDKEVPTENDYSALETIGWDLTGNAIIPGPPPLPPPPPNDNFASVQSIGGCSGSIAGSNIGATREASEPNNPNSPSSTKSVWYQWQAPSTGSVTIDTRGSVFDTVLAVYTGSSVGSLSLVGSNDDTEDPNTAEREVSSVVTFNATQGVVYTITVNGFDNAGDGGDIGIVKLNWSQANCTVTATPTPTPTPTATPTPAGPSTVALSAASYNVSEADATGVAAITVNRSGDTTTAISVDYFTGDQAGLTPCQNNQGFFASDRCDYATAIGTLRFAAGETAKTIQIPVIDDVYVEPTQTFTIALRNPQGASLGTNTTATVNILDNDTPGITQNPINDLDFFIKEQYVDFLGRVAEPGGFTFWKNRMTTSCPPGDICDRVDTAKRFFESDEFQERGFYIYRLYDAGIGRFPLYAEFVPEVARLNGPQTPAEQRLGKDAYLVDFMNKTEFKTLYDQFLTADHLHAKDSASAANFVNALCATAGITPASKQTLITNLQAGTRNPAQTLEDFILTPEMSGVGTKFYDRARIVMQYFGFLRRDPEPGGFDFWQNQLIGPNAPHQGDYRFMVNGFLRADEYNFRYALISAP